MAELVADRSVDDLLLIPGSRANGGPSVPSIPLQDRHLIDELKWLAWESREAPGSPGPPDIELERLAADYERTTGHVVNFSWERMPHSDNKLWEVRISIDGVVVGGCGDEISGDPEEDLVLFADRLQGEQLGEQAEGDWPKCPYHPNVLMVPEISDSDIASWVCQVDPMHAVRIGSLGIDPF